MLLRSSLVVLLALMQACSLPVREEMLTEEFTQNIRNHYELPLERLQKIQFYLSDALELSLEKKSSYQGINAQGQWVENHMEEGAYMHLKALLPGTVMDAGADWVSVNFGDNLTLKFGALPYNAQQSAGTYTLMADAWQGCQGQIQLDGQVYKTDKNACKLTLLFEKRLSTYQKNQIYTPEGNSLNKAY